MTSEEEMSEHDDELARRVYYLNTLHDLNQEISILKSVREVLEASLLYIVGVFGLKRGLTVIYKGDRLYQSAYFRIHKNTVNRWLKEFESHLENQYVREFCAEQDDADTPLAGLLKNFDLSIWIPLEVNEDTRGGIALGTRLSETPFTPDDLELLSTMAINIQNVMSNVSMIEALHQSVARETRIRNIFQRYAPEAIVNEVLNPTNVELLMGESASLRNMFDQMIAHLEEQYNLEKELDRARDVQQYLLPEKPPQLIGIEIAASSIPARYVCGDFYDFIALNPYEVGLSLGDVSGKGMSAAMIAAMLQSATRFFVGSYYPIPAILSILNRFIYRHTESGRYATMFYGLLNAENRTLTYSNAGHPPAILCRDGKLKMLDQGGMMVGIFEESSYEQDTVKLKPDDTLVIYSDGVTDAGTDPESDNLDDAFGEERLQSVILANASLPAREFMEAISNEVTSYAGSSKQFDDITMIVAKVK